MPEPRKRRIVRRAVWALAGVVLLASGYVNAFVGAHWLTARGSIIGATYDRMVDTVFAPARWYAASDFPAGYTLRRYLQYAWWHGKGQPRDWGDCDATV